MVLGSIFGDDLSKKSDTRLTIKVRLPFLILEFNRVTTSCKLSSIETLSDESVLDVHIPSNIDYPFRPPFLVFSNPYIYRLGGFGSAVSFLTSPFFRQLSSEALMEVHRSVTIESWSLIGQGMIYNLVLWLQEQIPVVLAPLRAVQEKGKYSNPVPILQWSTPQ